MQLPSCYYNISHTDLAVSQNIVNFILHTQTNVYCILYFLRHATSSDLMVPWIIEKEQILLPLYMHEYSGLAQLGNLPKH